MAQAKFIDQQRVKIETAEGDVCIMGFMGVLNYQMNERFDNVFLKFLEEMFDKEYDGDWKTVWTRFNWLLMKNGFESIFSLQLDRDKERERIGKRIKELRQKQNIEAKVLATKAGIDAANLCRIEQGKYSAGFDTLTKIAAALNMRIDFVEL